MEALRFYFDFAEARVFGFFAVSPPAASVVEAVVFSAAAAVVVVSVFVAGDDAAAVAAAGVGADDAAGRAGFVPDAAAMSAGRTSSRMDSRPNFFVTFGETSIAGLPCTEFGSYFVPLCGPVDT